MDDAHHYWNWSPDSPLLDGLHEPRRRLPQVFYLFEFVHLLDAPFGPWLVTQDEIEDPNNLKMWLKVNGETMQSSNSSNLHYKIPFLLSYVSQFMTLLPGDIISTGTPPGVGMGMDPQVYLQAEDLVELGIDQLGSSSQKVVPSV